MLRADFTQTIARELKKGKSINVFGNEGHGLNHFLYDLKTLVDADTVFIRVSMRSYADHYDGFIKDIAGQLNVKNDSNTAIELLISRFVDATNKKV